MLLAVIALCIAIALCITIIVLTFALHDCHLRKAMVWSMGLVIFIAMYSSSLVVVKQVIQTKSVEFMPFYLSFFSFLTSLLWMVYGILSFDILLTLLTSWFAHWVPSSCCYTTYIGKRMELLNNLTRIRSRLKQI